MGIKISKEEVGFLANFGSKSVEEQDGVLVQNGLIPLAEDKELKEFLDINGAYVGLIRGICDMVLKKKEDITTDLRADIIDLRATLSKNEQYITNREIEHSQHIEAVKAGYLEQIRTMSEELRILKASAGPKGILLTKEIGTWDDAVKKTRTRRVKKDFGDVDRDDNSETGSVISESSSSSMDSVNHTIRHLNINGQSERAPEDTQNHNDRNSNNSSGITILKNKDKEASPQTLKDSLHAPPDLANNNFIPAYHVGVMCAAHQESDNVLTDNIKTVMINNNINYVDIKQSFRNGNSFMIVSFLSEKDKKQALDINSNYKFIPCEELDVTLGNRRMWIDDIPTHLSSEEIIQAINEQIGTVINFELKHGTEFNMAKCFVEIKVKDRDFMNLWAIKCKNNRIMVVDNQLSEKDINNRLNTYADIIDFPNNVNSVEIEQALEGSNAKHWCHNYAQNRIRVFFESAKDRTKAMSSSRQIAKHLVIWATNERHTRNNNRNQYNGKDKQPKVTCKFWAQGRCRRNNCRFAHYHVGNNNQSQK